MIFAPKQIFILCFRKKCSLMCNHERHSFQSFIRHLGNSGKGSQFLVRSSHKKVRLTPAQVITSEGQNVGFRTLLRPLVFTTCFSGCCFLGASVWQYENVRKKTLHYHFLQLLDQFSSVQKRGEIRQKISQQWHNQSEGQKVASVIIAINAFIFMLWRIPALRPFMMSYFLCSPAMKAKCLPMFLSTFSHYSTMHLAANMCVLYSFSTTAVSFFGKEQFVALYCSSGVIAAFFSHLYKVISRNLVASLGASGALMAILSSSCIQFPDAILQVVFLPFLVIPAGHAIKIVMTVDAIGILAKWKLFDHACHLGGAAFGILYLSYGREYIWNKREPLVLWWHKIREGR